MGSKKFKLDLQDLWNVGKGALLVGSAAGLTYVAQNLGDIDFGEFGVLLVPIASTALSTLIEWLKDNDAENKE
jgi:hypothetical protein